MITIKGLSKSYGKKQVLRQIDIDFEKGKVYGIVGENGAGKTTFFRCLVGLESHEGSINSDFIPLKNHIGFLQTQPMIMARVTGWEYLKLLCLARSIKEDDFEERNIFELPLNQYAENYSTGMKKKLELMGVLLQKNEIFILDEPFNGVDIHSNMIISQIIAKLKYLDKTVLISSHIFSTLSDTCDEIFVLKEGAFSQRVRKENFHHLEKEMKEFMVGNVIDKLNLG